jgi:hypothetical protein
MSGGGRKGLEATVLRVREDLLSYDMDEAAVSAGPVKGVLDALGWDVFDPQAVCPEFRVGSGRVDFALRSAPSRVDVFIEVKAPGKADETADKQLFEYTVHHGVPLALVTDGRVWSFYLPGGQGNYEERRLFRLDLLERELAESCERLDRYLDRGKVACGAAYQAASQDYQDKTRELRVAKALPVVWRRLLEEPDELLVALLGEAIERENGERPPEPMVADFLRSQAVHSGTLPVRDPVRPPNKTPSKEPRANGPGYCLAGGAWVSCPDGKSAYVGLLRELNRRSPEFAERFARVKAGRKRAWIARRPELLFPGRADFQAKEAIELAPGSGWFVGAQTDPEEFEKRARSLCRSRARARA